MIRTTFSGPVPCTSYHSEKAPPTAARPLFVAVAGLKMDRAPCLALSAASVSAVAPAYAAPAGGGPLKVLAMVEAPRMMPEEREKMHSGRATRRGGNAPRGRKECRSSGPKASHTGARRRSHPVQLTVVVAAQLHLVAGPVCALLQESTCTGADLTLGGVRPSARSHASTRAAWYKTHEGRRGRGTHCHTNPPPPCASPSLHSLLSWLR